MRPDWKRCTAPPGTAYSRVRILPSGDLAPPRLVYRLMIGVGSTANQVERSPNRERKLSPDTVASAFVPSSTSVPPLPCHCPFPSRRTTWILEGADRRVGALDPARGQGERPRVHGVPREAV